MSTSEHVTYPGGDRGRHGLGVTVEYNDGVGAAAGVVALKCGADLTLSAAGIAAAAAQATTYLTSGTVASIVAAGAPRALSLFDATPAGVNYSCLAADAAAQVTALKALVTVANLSITAAASTSMTGQR